MEAMFESSEKSQDRHFGIPLAKWNGIQIELMLRSGLDHLAWEEKYSPRFQELLGRDPDLVRLVLTDEEAAVLEIEKRFRETE